MVQQKVVASLRIAVLKDVPANGEKAARSAYHKSPEFKEQEVIDTLEMLAETLKTPMLSAQQVAEALCDMKGIKLLTRRRNAISTHLANLRNKGYLKRAKERGFWEIVRKPA
jgi:hypothetical protein